MGWVWLALAALVLAWTLACTTAVTRFVHPVRQPYLTLAELPPAEPDAAPAARELEPRADDLPEMQYCERIDDVRRSAHWIRTQTGLLAWCRLDGQLLFFVLEGDPERGAGAVHVQQRKRLPAATAWPLAVAPWGVAYPAGDRVIVVNGDLETREARPFAAPNDGNAADLHVATDRQRGLYLSWLEAPGSLWVAHVGADLIDLVPRLRVPFPDCGWEEMVVERRGQGALVTPLIHCANGIHHPCAVSMVVDNDLHPLFSARADAEQRDSHVVLLLLLLVTGGFPASRFARAMQAGRVARRLRRGSRRELTDALAPGGPYRAPPVEAVVAGQRAEALRLVEQRRCTLLVGAARLAWIACPAPILAALLVG